MAEKIQIVQSLGIDISEIQARKHNIWLGISLSNKQFTSENIKALICGALEYTKEKIVIVVPGRLQAINYYYFDELSRAQALKIAFQDEEEMRNKVENIISTFSEEEKNKIKIISYDGALSPRAIKHRELFYREFVKQSDFYNEVMNISTKLLKTRNRQLDAKRAESIALYTLQELPFYVGGIEIHDDPTLYTATMYPGINSFDELVMKIITGAAFPELTKALNSSEPAGIVDIRFE